MNINLILKKQKEFFESGATLDTGFRLLMLKKLRKSITDHKDDILNSLKADLGKSDFESMMCEYGMALSEISYMIKHLKRFSKPKRVKTPISNFKGKSFVVPCPYGNVLIMSPWNYPFLLSIDPLCTAIAAGNTAVLKPSAYSPETSKLIYDIVSRCFPEEYIAVVTGGRKENALLLEQKYDLVFFTGSQSVGKEVLRHTAETLTPAVLELGGKSPCIVDETADLKLAARRIVFGKFLNCGQTCVAPDYILCDESIKQPLIRELRDQIKLQYGNDPLCDNDYGKIINEKHFDRILSLIDENKVVCGGRYDRSALKIEPTVMSDCSFDDGVMQQEIFGPVLPIITFSSFYEIYGILKDRQKPLALYLFTTDKQRIKDVTQKIRYGGGCVNDVIVHLATSEMGFGGVGESGMGSYHGKDGFDAFTHKKSVLIKSNFFDPGIRYRPYNRKKYSTLLEKLMK